jgi:uncharacterized protein YndB with AHSA1/START domain
VGTHRFTVDMAAPPAVVFDLYTNLERIHEWTGGVTGVSDLSGSLDRAGTTYVVHFGRMRSPTRVLEVERPRHFVTSFGNGVLRGESDAKFEPDGAGTRMSHEIRTRGPVAGLMARIFAIGSYRGSFRGELREFKRIAELEAMVDHP